VKAGDQTLVDGLIKDGLWDSFNDVHMGGLAEYTAKKAHLTRAMQDEFALASHRKAVAAMDHGLFRDEIVPVEIPGRKGPTMINADESPRRDTSMEVLSKLKPAFPKDAPKDMKPEELTVTAGNAPGSTTAPPRSSWPRRRTPRRTDSASWRASPDTPRAAASRRTSSSRRSSPCRI
jgi:acetyl-CoA C-acetyltransferase